MSENVEVEVDVFSGMPNPEWNLSDADAALFQQKIAALPEASPAQLANNLGYRGIIVRVKTEMTQTRILIQNGIVQSTQDDATVYCSDPGRDLERWLLNTGRPFIEDNIFMLVKNELAN